MQTVGTTEVKTKSVGKTPPRKATRAKAGPKETLHLKPHEPVNEQPTEDVTHMIATAAYFYAERRQFEPGHELEDWLLAERQVRDALQT